MKYNKKAEKLMAIGILVLVFGVGIYILDSLSCNIVGNCTEMIFPFYMILAGMLMIPIGFLFGGASEDNDALQERGE